MREDIFIQAAGVNIRGGIDQRGMTDQAGKGTTVSGRLLFNPVVDILRAETLVGAMFRQLFTGDAALIKLAKQTRRRKTAGSLSQ